MRVLTVAILVFTCLFAMGQNSIPTVEILVTEIEHPVFSQSKYAFSKIFTDAHNQVNHGYGFQTHESIPIYGAVFSAHCKNGILLSHHESFIPLEHCKANGDFILNEKTALSACLDHYSDHYLAVSAVQNEFNKASNGNFVMTDPSLSPEPIQVKKCWWYDGNNLIPSWNIIILLPNNEHWFSSVFSAIDGKLLNEYDRIISCQSAGLDHHHEFPSYTPKPDETASKKAGTGTYKAFHFPTESPSHGQSTAKTSIENSSASPYGWHDYDGSVGPEFTITRGNNVYASDDRKNTNNPGYSPDGGNKLVFDFDYYPTGSSDDNLDAAITNLFVWNNYMHDVWYQYGFDEESGNFQYNNYGNAADGDFDAVFADAQDGSGSNNANFATPEDGFSPRMQMFLWKVSSPTLRVESPASVKGDYNGLTAGFGSPLGVNPVKGKLVLVDDGSAEPTLACNDLINGAQLKGNIALIERGTCTFASKVKKAQNAGAIAVVIFNDNRPITAMGNDGSITGVTIPSMIIDRSVGLSLMSSLASEEVNVSLFDDSGAKFFDSDFDNGVIAHEYTHGISTRLTGGALNSDCLRNEEQMGEGWSDFFGLVMTTETGDKGTDLRGIGTYLLNQSTNGAGIRDYPYSTDTTISAYTYDDIKTMSVPHGVGSVWCSMLWDMYWAFIDKYGFDPDLYNGKGGNNMAMQLVLDGLKLQPCNPGFVDGRDAILLADKTNNGGANQLLIWEAFRKRGLGSNASQGSSSSRSDGKRGYKIPASVLNQAELSLTTPDAIFENEKWNAEVVVSNQSANDFTDLKVELTLGTVLNSSTTTTTCDAVTSGNVLNFNFPSLETTKTINCKTESSFLIGDYSTLIWSDSAEVVNERWTTFKTQGTGSWSLVTNKKYNGAKSWFASDPGTQSDKSLVLAITEVPAKNAALSFFHYYNTEHEWDGCVIETSVDNGSTWEDAGMYFIKNGYNSMIADNPESNISGREAFSGNSKNFIRSLMDISAFAGQPLSIRFRMVSDAASGVDGWYIDQIELIENLTIMNTVVVADQQSNISRAEATTIVFDAERTEIQSTENSSLRLVCFPNPFDQSIIVSTLGNGPGTVAGDFQVFDVNGQLIMQKKITANETKIDMANLKPGMYLVKYNDGQNALWQKMMKL